ncbi:MAG: hypothetical protein RL196_216 [Actinomycetota bacterium]
MSNIEAAKPAGRSLSKSIIVGLILGAVFLLSILLVKELMLVLCAAAACAGAWELSTALRIKGWRVPRLPAVIGSAAIMPAAYYFGELGQWIAAFGIVFALVIWRTFELWLLPSVPDRTFRHALRDFAAAAFVVIYLPLTTSFVVLLLRRSEDGAGWVIAFITTVAMIDTFGYLLGRVFGKHKMAPGVSPKKTLEGLLASVIAGSISAILFSVTLLHQAWWFGLIFAVALLIAAVFGDLAESLIKRDLGVKDMSSWLPGHGGVMDRLDSILPAALVTYLLCELLAR